ncbi:hypothetical protein, partial [Xanthomonas vasicola]|uniref:hypothetical protein n=1 Tax=Xanthomonas vasicola TaxID=56459 RepID=UPI0038A3BB66
MDHDGPHICAMQQGVVIAHRYNSGFPPSIPALLMTAKKAVSKSSTTSLKLVAERAVPVLATEPQAVTLEPVFAAMRKRYPT